MGSASLSGLVLLFRVSLVISQLGSANAGCMYPVSFDLRS